MKYFNKDTLEEMEQNPSQKAQEIGKKKPYYMKFLKKGDKNDKVRENGNI